MERAQTKGERVLDLVKAKNGSVLTDAAALIQAMAKVNVAGIDDLRLGREFAKVFSSVLAYVPELGSWAAYDGCKWVVEGGVQVAEQACKKFIEILAVVPPKTDAGDGSEDAVRAVLAAKESYFKKVSRYLNRNARCALLADAAAEMVVHLSEFDAKPQLFNCLNGTLEFGGDGGFTFRAHHPEDRMTKCAEVEYLAGARCPGFEAAVAIALHGDADTVEYLRRVLALALMGDNRFEKFHLLGEAVRSGKSTIVGAVLAMMGTGPNGYAVVSSPQTFAARAFASASAPSSDLARLRGARLIVASEPEEGMSLNCSLVKQLVGGDEVHGRPLYGKDITFISRAQLLMLCNSYPAIADGSLFASGRVRCIPFGHSIPEDERDPDLKRRLCEPRELSGVLNWILAGCEDALAVGLVAPEAVAAATAEYRSRHDAVGTWASERLIRADGCHVALADALADYREWATYSQAPQMGRNALSARLRQMGLLADRATVGGAQKRNVILGHSLRN